MWSKVKMPKIGNVLELFNFIYQILTLSRAGGFTVNSSYVAETKFWNYLKFVLYQAVLWISLYFCLTEKYSNTCIPLLDGGLNITMTFTIVFGIYLELRYFKDRFVTWEVALRLAECDLLLKGMGLLHINHQKHLREAIQYLILKGCLMTTVMSFFITTVGHRHHQALLVSHMLTYVAIHSIQFLQLFVVRAVIIRFDLLINMLSEQFMLNNRDIIVVSNEKCTLNVVQGASLVHFEMIKVMKYSNILFGWAVSMLHFIPYKK